MGFFPFENERSKRAKTKPTKALSMKKKSKGVITFFFCVVFELVCSLRLKFLSFFPAFSAFGFCLVLIVKGKVFFFSFWGGKEGKLESLALPFFKFFFFAFLLFCFRFRFFLFFSSDGTKGKETSWMLWFFSFFFPILF